MESVSFDARATGALKAKLSNKNSNWSSSNAQLNFLWALNLCPNDTTSSQLSLAATWISNPTQHITTLEPNDNDHLDSIRVQLYDRKTLVEPTSRMGAGENDVPWASQKSQINDESSPMIINTAWPLFHASQAALDLSYPSNPNGELLTNDRNMNMVEVSGSTPPVSALELQHVPY